MNVLITGSGGFIGHHLTKYLVALGHNVRGVDLKHPDYEKTSAQEFFIGDLRDPAHCKLVMKDIDEVYHLAADMGGIGYITSKLADIAHNNILIDANMLKEAAERRVRRFFYASSACVYPQELQETPTALMLAEDDAIPANPEPGYGWEKLFAEELCRYYRKDYGLETRIARFHNVYGPLGTFVGGKEKAPAALCRKIAQLGVHDSLEIWGDGLQTRSFLYVSDCIEGIYTITQSNKPQVFNLGSDRLISIDGLVGLILDIAKKNPTLIHDMSKPQGVRGRNSNNRQMERELLWTPKVSLEDGLRATYRWILQQI